MKKLITLIFLLTFLSSFAFAKPAIFYPDNLTVDLQCIRAKKGETIGSECYDVVLKVYNNGIGAVSISKPFTSPIENTDQTFDVDTFVLEIPYLMFNGTSYYINLRFNPATGLLSIQSYGISTITPDDSSGNNDNGSDGVVGSCYVDTSAIGSTLCQEANAGCDAAAAKHACDILKGQWRAGVSCKEGDLGSCYYIPNGNGCTLNQEYYDTGIIDLYVSTGVNPSIVYEGMQDACKNLGGVYERSTK